MTRAGFSFAGASRLRQLQSFETRRPLTASERDEFDDLAFRRHLRFQAMTATTNPPANEL